MSTPVSQVLSQWTKSFPFCSMSSNEFYTSVAEIVKSHKMPNCKIGRVDLKEGGLMSSSREYLRIQRNDIVLDLCAAPFGTDFFISWWMYETESLIHQILGNSYLGTLLRNVKKSKTFYQADEEAMFRGCVHECVIEAIDLMTKNKGIRELTDVEKLITKGSIQ